MSQNNNGTVLLEEFDVALARAGRKVVTQYGDSVEIVRYNGRGRFPIVAVLDDGETYEAATFDIKGRDDRGHQVLYLYPGKDSFIMPASLPDDFFRSQNFWLVSHLRADRGYLCDPEDCKLFRKKDKVAMLAYVQHKNSQYNDACTRKGLVLTIDRKRAMAQRKDIFVPIWIGTENPGRIVDDIDEYNAINNVKH